MGNCSQKSSSSWSLDVKAARIRVWTETGQLMEFEGPRIAREVLGNFPGGYGLFRGGEMGQPLSKEEQLHNGHVYYAFPLKRGNSNCRRRVKREYLMSPCTTTVESLPTKKNGVWRVKLAISVEELDEILAGQVSNMESLIHELRMGQGYSTRN